jgi:hypothetical protein
MMLPQVTNQSNPRHDAAALASSYSSSLSALSSTRAWKKLPLMANNS